MQRLLVALLAAVDAVIAAAVGLAVLLAPLTLLWTVAFGTTADWGALWPATGLLWQFGHAVPLDVVIGDDVLVAVGIPAEAAEFTLSVAPMAFLVFTLLFAARSGTRAARAGAWMLGVIAGTVAFCAISVGVALTAGTGGVATSAALGITLPTVVYLVGSLSGAALHAWREGDEGLIDRLHDVVDGWGEFGPVLPESLRGAAIAIVQLVGMGALAVAVMVALRAGDVLALYESTHVDVLGATAITLGQLAYLPTLVVWAVAWLAGPGFAVGAGTAVSPAGTQLGVVPGIPIFGLVPENGSIWMMIVVLLPIAAGAVAGWMVRSRLVWEDTGHGWAPRAAIAGGIAAVSAGVAALAAWAASGSIGPGRLAEAGPHPGWMALAIGVEVLIGAGILLLSPRHRDELAEERTDRWIAEMGVSPTAVDETVRPEASESPAEHATVPIEESEFFGRTSGDGGAPQPR